jgi:Zn-dependent protease
MQNSQSTDAAEEIEHVKGLVARHFPVYDVRVNHDVVEFYCKIDESILEESFGRLREEMAPQGYIPMVTYDKGEHVIVVGKKPRAKYRSIYVNFATLVITLATVTLAGVLYWAAYAGLPDNEIFSLRSIGTGILVFTLPLMTILGAHELAHFFAARRRKVAASLPFFIPSVPPFGTFGAFISLRDPIPSRKSLLEIGIAGPLAGILVAIPIGIAGLMLTNMEARVVPDNFEAGDSLSIALPLIYTWLQELVPVQGDYQFHPTAFAAWVGFWVTAINLLPAGQLDGGHIARAVFGKYAKYAGWATIFALIALSYFFLAWGILAILIIILGLRHPPPLNDITRLDRKRKAVGILAFAILLLAFVPVPMWVTEVDHSFEMTPLDDVNVTMAPGETTALSFSIESLGNVKSIVVVESLDTPVGWVVGFRDPGEDTTEYYSSVSYGLNVSETAIFDARITVSESATPGNQTITFAAFAFSSEEEVLAEGAIWLNITVTQPSLEFWIPTASISISAGDEATAEVQVNNTGPGNIEIVLIAFNYPSMVGVALYEDTLLANSTGTLNLTVPAQSAASFEVLIFVSSQATHGEATLYIMATYHDIELSIIELPIVIE